MILVTRVNNQRIHLNPDLLEAVEEAGDTVLLLVNGHRLVVRESAEEIVTRIHEYRKSLLAAVRLTCGDVDRALRAAALRCPITLERGDEGTG